MSAQNPATWFEIPAKDLQRAKAFYEYVFDFEMTVHFMGPLKMAWFPGAQGQVGATGSLMENPNYKPSHEGSLIYFAVRDIEATLQKVREKDGKILNPKMSIGEHGFVGHFEDCEGNRVALHATK